MVLTVSDPISSSAPDTAVITVVDQFESIETVPGPVRIACYPNPSSGTIHLRIPAGETIREVTVAATDGRILYRTTDRYPGPGTIPLDLREHFNGEHAVIIRITGNSSASSQLIILQKP
jgi:hypothetical protein